MAKPERKPSVELDKHDRAGTFGMVFGQGHVLQFSVVKPDHIGLEGQEAAQFGSGALISEATATNRQSEVLHRIAARAPVIRPAPKGTAELHVKDIQLPIPRSEDQLNMFEELRKSQAKS